MDREKAKRTSPTVRSYLHHCAVLAVSLIYTENSRLNCATLKENTNLSPLIIIYAKYWSVLCTPSQGKGSQRDLVSSQTNMYESSDIVPKTISWYMRCT